MAGRFGLWAALTGRPIRWHDFGCRSVGAGMTCVVPEPDRRADIHLLHVPDEIMSRGSSKRSSVDVTVLMLPAFIALCPRQDTSWSATKPSS